MVVIIFLNHMAIMMKQFITKQTIHSFNFVFDLCVAGQITSNTGQHEKCALNERSGGIQ
ncbi:hypothetical protein PCN061_3144 [Escherichia coli PCN061]|nr:hypothetical protein PCN061_3144 [Escherichia coli PCN061]